MASGSKARKRRRTVVASTSGGLVSHTMAEQRPDIPQGGETGAPGQGLWRLVSAWAGAWVQYNGWLPEIEMLTPKGEHSIPCSTRVMFDGRISFDGIATVKTL